MCDEALGRFIHELLDERGLNVVKHGAVVARTRLREAVDRLIQQNEGLKENSTRNEERYERAEQINGELVRGLENAGETMRMIRGRCDVGSLQEKKKAEEIWLPVIDNLARGAQAEIKRLLEEDRS